MVQRDPGGPSVGEQLPPSQGHSQSSICGQNIISRVRWLGIYSLHTGQKKKNRGESIWIHPKQELPALMGEGAAGLLWEPCQKANNYCGFSQCYWTLLPGGLNPDTATVQLWKQHQFILLMPSSLQYLLMKAELVCLDCGPICWGSAVTGDGKALFLLPPRFLQDPKQNPLWSGKPCLCFPMTFEGSRGNSIRICSSFYLCPKIRGAAEATETVEFPQGPSALIAFNRRLTFWSS